MTSIDTSTEAVDRMIENVTPGPWTVENRRGNTCLIMGDSCEMCDETYYPWVPSNHYDWHFFAAARDLVPALLKERDEARAQLAASQPAEAAKAQALVDALEFYANRDNYETVYEQMPCDCCTNIYEPVVRDAGDTARTALAAWKERK